jgi:glycosyltransferase involved in cell wall biosynthesis
MIPRKKLSFPLGILVIGCLGTSFLWLQYYASVESQKEASKAIIDLEKIDMVGISYQKNKQEAISLALRNAQDKLLVSSFITRITAAGAGFVTACGFLLAIFQYLELRIKEQDQDITKLYGDLWSGLLADEHQNSKFVLALCDIHDVFQSTSPDQIDSGFSVLSLFGKSLRTKFGILNEDKVLANQVYTRALRLSILKFPKSFINYSWDGIHCTGLDLSGLQTALVGINFTGSLLQNCNFNDVNLANSNFKNSYLMSTKFINSILRGVNFDHADLSNTDFSFSDLTNASLHSANILNANFDSAILKGPNIGYEMIDWKLSRNWRNARFDEDTKKKLITRYGPDDKDGIRILFLLWEYPHQVAGGGWTAAYFIIRALRLMGVNITVAVPWCESEVSSYVLGNDITLIACGEEVSSSDLGITKEPQYVATYNHQLLIDFSASLKDRLNKLQSKFDVVIAHDWLTMPAADQISKDLKCPWIAHFHSIGSQRQRKPVNTGISQIEKTYGFDADHVFVPGTGTLDLVLTEYGFKATKVSVFPNPMLFDSKTDDFNFKTSTVGDYHSQLVIFSGRLQWQKGIDKFVDLIRLIGCVRPGTNFSIFGKCSKEDSDTYKDLKIVNKVFFVDGATIIPLPDSVTVYDIQPVEIHHEECILEYRLIGPRVTWADLMPLNYNLGICLEDSNAHLLHYRFYLEEIREDSEHKKTFLVRIQYKVNSDTPGCINIDSGDPEAQIYKKFEKWESRLRVFVGATVCVVPSRHEPFGMVVLESMAMGVPVIYPIHAGVSEKINSGIKINFDDKNNVAREIMKLLDSPEYWSTVVKQQTDEIAAYVEYSKNELPENLLAHVRRLMEAKQPEARKCGPT